MSGVVANMHSTNLGHFLLICLQLAFLNATSADAVLSAFVPRMGVHEVKVWSSSLVAKKPGRRLARFAKRWPCKCSLNGSFRVLSFGVMESDHLAVLLLGWIFRL